MFEYEAVYKFGGVIANLLWRRVYEMMVIQYLVSNTTEVKNYDMHGGEAQRASGQRPLSGKR